MKLQFVFGNPQKKGKSKKVTKKGGSKVAKKKGKKKGGSKKARKKARKLIAGKKGGAVTIRHSAKKGAPRIKISKVGNPKRRKRKKNPISTVYWQRPPANAVNARAKFRTVGKLLTSGDKGWVVQEIGRLKQQISQVEALIPGYKAKTGLSDIGLKRQVKALKTKIAKFEALVKQDAISSQKAMANIKELQKKGYQVLYQVNHGHVKDKPAPRRRRKSTKGKKGKGKGKKGKKGKGKGRKKGVKRKKNPIFTLGNPKKKKTSRRRSKMKSIKIRKGQSMKLMTNPKGFKIRRTNPLGGIMGQIERFTGHTMAEAGSLALGGALYGVVNTSMARYAKPVHSALAKVPVVGNALPTLIAGALLNYLGERQGIAALQTVGKGLVGASVVGMGVNAAQMVPGLKGGAASPGLSLSGVDYTLEGYGQDEADFGTLPEGMGSDDADFGGVDFTMEGDGQMGYDEDYAGVDFTMEGYGEGDEADFGETPEGLGEGQMG